MPNIDEKTCSRFEPDAGEQPRPGGVLSGTVVAHLDRRSYLVQPTTSSQTFCCELAVGDAPGLKKGSRVLISRDQLGHGFITALLPDSADRPGAGQRQRDIVTGDGTRAVHAVDSRGESLQVRDGHGRVMFEYRPDEQAGSMTIKADNITVDAARHFEICAGQGIRVSSGQDVDMGALGAFNLSAGPEGSGRIELGAQRLGMDARQLDCSARSVDFRFSDARCLGRTMHVRLDRMTSVVRTLELRVRNLIERAGEVFRSVAGVSRLNAKRVRTVCQQEHEVVAREIRLDGERAVKLQGDKIDLG